MNIRLACVLIALAAGVPAAAVERAEDRSGWPTIEAYRQLDPGGRLAVAKALDGLEHAASPDVRTECAAAIGRMAADRRQRRWVRWLGAAYTLANVRHDQPTAVIKAHAWALGQIGPEAGKLPVVATKLMLWSREGNCDLRCCCLDALVKIGEPPAKIMPLLMQSLPDARDCYFERATKAFVCYRWEAVGELAREMVTSPSTLVRRRAADAIGELGDAGAGTEEALGKAAGDREPEVRIAVVGALSRVGPVSGKAAAWVGLALGDSDQRVRQAAADGLGRLGRRSKSAAANAANVLLTALGDPNLGVREGAWRALEALGSKLNVAPPLIVQGLKSDDPMERLSAAIRLKESGSVSEEVGKAVFEAVRDRDYVMREPLVAGLAMPHSKDASVAALLGRVADAEGIDSNVRSLARVALRRRERAKQER
jgi:HEAT repeat protein